MSIVKNKGRIVYIEPTEFAGYSVYENGQTSTAVTLDNVSWNLEDLQFNIDLRVISPDRFGSLLPVNVNKEVNSNVGFTSFLQGNELNGINYLTDSYTDITFQEISPNGASQKEALGIDSIDINFDSHFFPLVNIKFTDVRAAALFGPTDNEYVHNKRIAAIINDDKLSEEEKAKKISDEKNKMSSSFFKALFHFPYPRFMLSVMGYYGERVTFQLSVNDFKTSFNSTNGNFDVNVSFIGYMYGLYTDLPMSLVFTSPYYNQTYWDDAVKSGRFYYNEGQPILKFIDFLRLYYTLNKEDNPEGISNLENAKIYSKLINGKSLLENILNLFNEFDSTFTSRSGYVYHQRNKKDPKAFVIFSSTKTDHKFLEGNLGKYTNLVNAVSSFNSEYATGSDNLDVNYLSSYGKDDIEFNEVSNNTIKSSNPNIKEINDVVDELNSIKDYAVPGIKDSKEEFVDSLNIGAGSLEKYAYSKRYYTIYYRGDLKDKILENIKKYSDEIEKRRGDADKEMLDYVEKKLTFRPTIENIFRMIFAHIETFMNSLRVNVLDNIKTSIGNGDGKRSAGYLGLTNKNSDITPSCDSKTSVAPFPLCKDEKNGTYEYPGTFISANSNINNIVEVKFVEKIVDGIKDFNKKADEIKNLIESLEPAEKEIFDLISVSDVFNKGKNPYIVLKDKLSTVQEDYLKACNIEYFIYARLIMYMLSKTTGLNTVTEDELNGVLTKELGYLEKANIIINNNTKFYLTNGTAYGLKGDSLVYPKNGDSKDKLSYCDMNQCYYFNNPFNKSDSNNLYSNSSKVLTVLDKSYNDIISQQDIKDLEASDDNEKLIKKDETVKKREKWEKKNSGDDEHILSYINEAGTDKGKIGYAGDAFTTKGIDNFGIMHTQYLGSDDAALSHYHAGFLQIGERREKWKKEFDPRDSAIVESLGELQDDLYLGISIPKSYTNQLGDNKEVGDYVHDENEPAMYGQLDKYFRAFLLLGCLSTYFKQENTNLNTYFVYHEIVYGSGSISTSTIPVNKNINAKLFKYPKALYLYYGACIYFRKNTYQRYKDGFNNGTIRGPKLNSNKNEDVGRFALINLRDYMNENDVIKFNDYNKQYIIKTFTNKATNQFLGKYSDNCTTVFLSENALNDLEDYFINWVNSGDFKQIDDILSNTRAYNTVTMKNPDDSYHKFKETQFKIRAIDSVQDLYIKKLLCEDLTIYKRPESTNQWCLSFSGTNEKENKKIIVHIKEFFSKYKTEEDIKTEEIKEEENNASDFSEQKKALYYTLKRLYDRWLSSYNLSSDDQQDVFLLNQPFQDKMFKQVRYSSNGDSKVSSEFNSFIFVDSFFRDISDKFLTNPDIFKDLISTYTNADIMNSNASVFEFMNEIAEKNGLLFASLPIYSNFYDAKTITNMFSPNKKYNIGSNSKSDVPGNTYVIMYTGEASSKLDFGNDSEYDGDGITDIDDVFECAEDKIPTLPQELQTIIKNSEDDEAIDFVLPIFGVTFGKQNQMYFKNITVNMDNPKVTDYSIANLISISHGGGHGDNEDYNVGIGQDLYSIYANRSYTCTVEMLGCINIMPMMYFQLNNIPMFRGLYIIINVSHTITPGNMTTKFTGVRVSKNHIGLVKSIFSFQSQLDKINTEGVVLNFDNDGNPTNNGQASPNSKPSKKLSDDWLKNIETMGDWYEKNIHTYQGGPLNQKKGVKWYYECPLIGDTTVADDCSGFVKACLQAQGISALDNLLVNTTTMQPGKKFEEILKENGFERLNYSESEQRKGDIIVGGPQTHTEIFWDAKHSYGWGNIHDLNRPPGMPYYRAKIAYKYIYRKK